MARKTCTKQAKQVSKILFRTMPIRFKITPLNRKTEEFLTLGLVTRKVFKDVFWDVHQ